jgi:hypothetical protein
MIMVSMMMMVSMTMMASMMMMVSMTMMASMVMVSMMMASMVMLSMMMASMMVFAESDAREVAVCGLVERDGDRGDLVRIVARVDNPCQRSQRQRSNVKGQRSRCLGAQNGDGAARDEKIERIVEPFGEAEEEANGSSDNDRVVPAKKDAEPIEEGPGDSFVAVLREEAALDQQGGVSANIICAYQLGLVARRIQARNNDLRYVLAGVLVDGPGFRSTVGRRDESDVRNLA